MSRLRSLIGQSPAIAIATLALVLSFVGGATAATVSGHGTKAPVVWHQLTLTNGWKYGGFGSFHAAYYVDASHIVHLRGSARIGKASKPVFTLPSRARPGHAISEIIYASGGIAAAISIGTNGHVSVFDQTDTDSAVRDFTSFDGLSFSLG
ncbi:MAG TPA: hypothetical protein VGM14_00580 [Streptosporangiaceae bacterium]|jgi:hypothetical protein